MHIIKITPNSFKIILTKEDLQRDGVNNIFENNDLTGDFFKEIMEQTERLYGTTFSEGSVDAEFFESKDGGGELFICASRSMGLSAIYFVQTKTSETLYALCRRLEKLHIHSDSRLYSENNLYILVVFLNRANDLLLSILSEYGTASKSGKFALWHLDEHAHVILKDNAVERLSRLYK